MTETGKLTASAPVLLVRDVVAAANHYRDALGFSYDKFYGENGPSFVILARDGMFLMLKQAVAGDTILPYAKQPAGVWNVYFWVRNIDALHRRMVQQGAIIDYGPCDQPYGVREFGIRDLDGYDIGFGENNGQ